MPKITKNSSLLAAESLPLCPDLVANSVPQDLQPFIKADQQQFSQQLSAFTSTITKIDSISAQNFALLFKKVVLSASYERIREVVDALVSLAGTKFSQEEVIWELKKIREIDSVLLLNLLLKNYQLNLKKIEIDRYLPILNLITNAYPVDLLMHGKLQLQKLREIVDEKIELQRMKQKTQKILNTKNNQLYGNIFNQFSDIIIPL